VTADAEAYRQRMREARDGKPPGRPKPATRQSDRFAPLNALVDGGHLAKLTPRELKVWIALYRHASADGTMRVSGSTLGRLAGIEREHASGTTKRLERLGYIECVTRGRTMGQAGKRTANVFRLLAPPPNSANGGTNQGHE
jgi:hypothetical protein